MGGSGRGVGGWGGGVLKREYTLRLPATTPEEGCGKPRRGVCVHAAVGERNFRLYWQPQVSSFKLRKQYKVAEAVCASRSPSGGGEKALHRLHGAALRQHRHPQERGRLL